MIYSLKACLDTCPLCHDEWKRVRSTIEVCISCGKHSRLYRSNRGTEYIRYIDDKYGIHWMNNACGVWAKNDFVSDEYIFTLIGEHLEFDITLKQLQKVMILA